MKKLYTDLGFAKVDVDRCSRRGFPEVIYCQGKTKEQVLSIAKIITQKRHRLLLTKVNDSLYAYLKTHLPRLKFNPLANIAYQIHSSIKPHTPHKKGLVLVITAGTADINVAEEAAATLEAMGAPFKKLYDVGVAGVHRLMDKNALLKKAAVIIVVAGMEGALASIVSGLVRAPVIAVPTSCGYGASFKGLSALLTMLNSCSPGVAVVNIDNGFGAGYFASIINR